MRIPRTDSEEILGHRYVVSSTSAVHRKSRNSSISRPDLLAHLIFASLSVCAEINGIPGTFTRVLFVIST